MATSVAPPAASLVATTCRLCGASDLYLYHDQGYRRLAKCRRCRLVFADPLPTPRTRAFAFATEAGIVVLGGGDGERMTGCVRRARKD